MRKILLATTAAAALVAGMTLAGAQGGRSESGAGGQGGQMQSGQGEHQKGGQERGATQGQRGAQQEQKGKGAERSGTEGRQQGAEQERGKGAEGQRKGAEQERGKGTERQQRGAEQERRGTESQRGAEQERRGSESTRGAERGGGGGSVQLSSEQRTKIRQTVISNSSARVDRVDFSLSVGVTVPRSVHVVRLPETVVEIVPQYRGYDYIIVGDQIVIIEPRTLRIVAIIPA